MDYQRLLALMGIQSIKISEYKFNKDGNKTMADLRNKPINPDDDELIVDAPLDIWDSVLPLGLWDAVVVEKPIGERSKNKHALQLPLHLELTVNDGGKRKGVIYLPLEGNGLRWTREQLDDLGVSYVHDGIGSLRIKSLKAFVGLKCKAEVAENKWNGNVTNKIKRLYSIDHVEES